jgi:hypothetical protein
MKLEKSIHVNCAPEKAFAFATDFDKEGMWREGVSTYSWKAKALGQTMETLGEVTVWSPPFAYEWKATKSAFPLAGGMKFQADGSGTLVTLFTEATPGGFFKLAEGLMMSQMEKQFAGNLETLKKLLEE